MKEEIIIAGFGGQGVLSMGKILAHAALLQGLELSWIPAYGPEQRGGTCHVTVILSDQRISSPIVNSFDTAILLNQPSLERFEDKIKPGGTLIYDGTGVRNHPSRTDIQIYRINASEYALANQIKTSNMLILGGLVKVRDILLPENILLGLEKTIPTRHHHLLPMNKMALEMGKKLIQKK